MATYDLGTLPSSGAAVTRNGYNLSSSDATDVFRFRLASISDINASLTRISSGDDADIRLYRDTNNNGFLDSSDRTNGLIQSSTLGSNRDDAINVADQSSTPYYFAEVSRYAFGSTGDVTYNLALSTANPSNLLPTENLVGDLSADRNFSGSINNFDTADTYRFSIGFNEAVNINLSGLTGDLDIRLVRDDGDRIVETGEVLLNSTLGGIQTDRISINDTGEYFLQVYQYSNTASNYNLNFDYFTTGPA